VFFYGIEYNKDAVDMTYYVIWSFVSVLLCVAAETKWRRFSGIQCENAEWSSSHKYYHKS